MTFSLLFSRFCSLAPAPEAPEALKPLNPCPCPLQLQLLIFCFTPAKERNG